MPLRIPIGDPAQEPARPGRHVENPNLAQLELSQIQSIGPVCTNADIASLQIRTTAGVTFSSHSSCFPYVCDTASRTCATGCGGGKGCAPGMDCVGGRCIFPRTLCSDGHTSTNSSGAKNDCETLSGSLEYIPRSAHEHSPGARPSPAGLVPRTNVKPMFRSPGAIPVTKPPPPR